MADLSLILDLKTTKLKDELVFSIWVCLFGVMARAIRQTGRGHFFEVDSERSSVIGNSQRLC